MLERDSNQQNGRQDVGAVAATAQAEIDGERDGDCRQQLGENGGFEQRVNIREGEPMRSDDTHGAAHHQANLTHREIRRSRDRE